MNHRDYTTKLKKQTATQEYQPQLEFAVLICNKLYFDYQKFTEVEKWGDANLLRDAINTCQQALGKSVDINQVKYLIQQVDSIIPDMDDFGSELSSYALNASAAVCETLQFIIDRDKSRICDIASYYTDTIDFKIQEDKELTELEIENHPLMIEAWNFVLHQTKNEGNYPR